jgi:hypothetical protein
MLYFSLYPIKNRYQTKATDDNIASELYCLNIPIFYHNVIIFLSDSKEGQTACVV